MKLRLTKSDKMTAGGKERPLKVFVQIKNTLNSGKIHSTVEKTSFNIRKEKMIKLDFAFIFSFR